MAGSAQHGLTCARAEINDHPFVAGDQIVELADVHFEETAADDLSHSRIVIGMGRAGA